MNNPFLELIPGVDKAYTSYNGKNRKILKAFQVKNNINELCYISGYKVTYHANGGIFSDGSTTNTVYYDINKKNVTKISKTPNVSDDGLTADTSTGYGNSQSINDIITIPGATSLNVTITYQTESTNYDWVCLYDNSVTPSSSNYSSSISGKLGGATKTTKTFTIDGDTVQIYFKSDVSTCYYYGYYATITGMGDKTEVIQGNDEINISNDGFYFLCWLTKDNKILDLSKLNSNIDVYAFWSEVNLMDFDYSFDTENMSIILNDWKGTYLGSPSTEIIVLDSPIPIIL